jgi:thiamine pyrophosphate-dependent acetolactate synthase large subunit-like protein
VAHADDDAGEQAGGPADDVEVAVGDRVEGAGEYGDGAAGFNVTEIETALRFGTPYVAVIAHDGAWGIVADGQEECRRVACQFGEIRFDRVAQAFGAEGVYISDPRELQPAIEQGLRADHVVVIHVPTQLAGVSHWQTRYGQGECGTST